jgi:hypothetical protein
MVCTCTQERLLNGESVLKKMRAKDGRHTNPLTNTAVFEGRIRHGSDPSVISEENSRTSKFEYWSNLVLKFEY